MRIGANEPPLAMATSALWWLPSFLCRSRSAKLLAREKLFLNIFELRIDAASCPPPPISYGGVGGVETMTESSDEDPTLSRASLVRRLPELFALESRFVRYPVPGFGELLGGGTGALC